MHVNDYAKWGGYVVKVISGQEYHYNVSILETNKNKTDVSCTHINLLKQGVLEACGFTKNKTGGYFECQLQNHNIIACIKYANKTLKRICSLEIRDNGMLTIGSCNCAQYVISLDDLQDFVRNSTGMELEVNENKLLKAVKNDRWRI